MQLVIADIFERLEEGPLSQEELDALLRARSRQRGGGRRLAKKDLYPYYLREKTVQSAIWRSWKTTPETERAFEALVRMKPRRSASGVATITVLTKPWACHGACLYCPNDPRMPKSYLRDEPACQRAERVAFDPYLQIAARLRTLAQMGHATDKVEVIVLGGTWQDYPETYRLWFCREIYRALNGTPGERSGKLDSWHAGTDGLDNGEISPYADLRGTRGLSYNDAVRTVASRPAVVAFEEGQHATWCEIELEQQRNETAGHRLVGLVFETRPDSITGAALRDMRRLGCTKVQVGIQALEDRTLDACSRGGNVAQVERALALVRSYGFKSHVHFMVNLPGSTPEQDLECYRRLVSDARFMPDELKLYPCALVDGTDLMDLWRNGTWRPYTEEELVDLLAACVAATPPWTRISRMIRDISSKDIVTGNKKTNLRQMVERHLAALGTPAHEMRLREVGTGETASELHLAEEQYATANTHERFLQWVDSQERLYGFLRLSLPQCRDGGPSEAMIREVHVYGFAERVGQEGSHAQHRGLGRAMVQHACEIAAQEGFQAIRVISAVGTRDYYRALGFTDDGLYQIRRL